MLLLITVKQSVARSAVLLMHELREVEKLCGCKISHENMLYKASLFDYSAKAFHDSCDRIPNTLAIVEAENGYVFGGFTSKTWEGVESKGDANAFIFSFKNERNKPEKILINPSRIEGAITCGPNYGPLFGCELFIADKYNEAKMSSCNCSGVFSLTNDSHLAGFPNFIVKNYEVYKAMLSSM
jgi:hypothetical protein